MNDRLFVLTNATETSIIALLQCQFSIPVGIHLPNVRSQSLITNKQNRINVYNLYKPAAMDMIGLLQFDVTFNRCMIRHRDDRNILFTVTTNNARFLHTKVIYAGFCGKQSIA